MKGKIFSRQEATRMLPLVRRIVTDAKACCTLIARHKRDLVIDRDLLDDKGVGLAKDEIESTLTSITEHEEKLEVLREKRATCEQELEELGAFLGDAEKGIVKFYGEIDSEIVYFTWKLGEPEVAFWHGIDDDFADRQAIDGDEKVAQNAEA